MADSDLINRLASSSEQKTALQFAFYNTLLFVLVGLCSAGIYAVYKMMYMFLTPIMWATLVGTVLFPLKRKITSVLKGWLQHLDETDTPLSIGVLLLPYNFVINVSECVYTTLISQNGVFIVGAYFALKILSYERTFMYFLRWMGDLYQLIDGVILFFSQKWIIPLIVLYASAYWAWIYVQDVGAIHKKFARTLGLPIWFFVLSFVSQFFGPVRVVVFSVTAIVLALISAGIIGSDAEEIKEKVEEKAEEVAELVDGALKNASDPSKEEPREPEPIPAEKDKSDERLDKAITGDSYLRIICGLCLLLWIVRHDSAVVLVLLPLGFAMLRKLGEALGVQAAIAEVASTFGKWFHEKSNKFVNIMVAGSLRKFVKLLFTSDRMFLAGFTNSIDLISSVAVMAVLAFGSLFIVFFVGFQLHGETVHLVKLGSNVLSQQPDWLGFAVNYTEGQLKEHDIDDYVEQAYQQGRAWLASNARALADPNDVTRADMLENQVNKMVDNLYQMWEERNSKVSAQEAQEVAKTDWLSQLKGTTDLTELKTELTNIVKENIETLLSIAQGLWSVVILNISFLTSILGSITGLLLSFGAEMANFFIEVIVFLTAVYYLLAFSTDQWLPLKWMSTLTPRGVGEASGTSANVTGAIERAISGVFVLSAKMAIFYGLYTYFVHSLFDLNIVFVPSMLAAVFAAIPIMAPYFVCVFGLVELYLVRGEAAAAIVFVIASVAPIMFADATFYREVKGSHPYVTGLAIVGGMYWLGLQGAIIGPIVLCCMMVLINIYTEFVRA
ncbi:hypothetical protein QR680_015180 [Steinernema hermaphroditum]|uniref:Transmembrane protein 245 n=1 Tax=Steinernema hermaphroditum TaxID=289476 RepID=A0AA39IE19_9BILA|nr:hypothetical protein QR680_015180 [Steinernema hermaphroditum]